MGYNILFVDDEKAILKALQRTFAETDYQIFTATSGIEALEVLNTTNIDLVVSDMRMPMMDGHQLLRKIKQLYPSIIRIILSGYAEEKHIFQALVDGSTKLYLLKPWDNSALIQIVKHMFDIRDMLKSKSILKIVNKIDGLPTSLIVYNRLTTLLEQDAEMQEIVALIETDPALTVRVLNLANSAFYGNKTGSVNQAINYLGLAIIKDVVFAASVFEKATSQRQKYNRIMYWKHAKLCNKLVVLIYEQVLKKKLSENGATAGLLHDIGKLFLLQYFSQEYTKHSFIRKTEIMNIATEKELFGVSHQEIGGYLLNWWELPYPIIEATLFHHSPLKGTFLNSELVCVVHIADYYAWKLLNKVPSGFNEEIFSVLGISQERCDGLLQRFRNEACL